MKNFLVIALFTTVTSVLYTAIGYMLPQLESHPPPVVGLGEDIGPEDLGPIGAGVYEANCVQCHKMGESGRAPDLANAGGLAPDRAKQRARETGESYTDVDYLLESLCKPGDYLVKGFGNIMPAQQRSLSGGQILAVVAFLQNQGGEATVRGTDVEPVERFGCSTGGAGGGGAGAPVASADKAPVGDPQKAFTKFACDTCHALEDTERKLGPSLVDVGARLSKGEIYESLLVPDAKIAPGDPPYSEGLMKQTLDANGFYDQMTPVDYQKLVDWLAEKKG